MARPITFLSDYGTDDEFAGVCRAVIARIAPGIQVLDLTHGIARHDVRGGAAVLAGTLAYAPAGVHLAVVDPGVGTPRRAVAVRVTDSDRVLVGPDNGLLVPAIEQLGGVVEAVDVSRSPVRLEPLSATFHGRDVFAPVAAHLALGATLAELGEQLSPETLTRLSQRPPDVEAGASLRAEVSHVDQFGNAALIASSDDAAAAGLRPGAAVTVEAGGRSREGRYALTFADVPAGELVLYLDSYGALALAVNRGSAAESLAIASGDAVALRPR